MRRPGDFRKIELFASRALRLAGGRFALPTVILLLLGWLMLGPTFRYSLNWQSAMVLPTAAITFIMVFLLLRTQAKDTQSMQMKLNEIVAALNGANNQLIDIENKSEGAIAELSKRYHAVATQFTGDPNDSGATSTKTILPHKMMAEIARAERDLHPEKPAGPAD